MRCITGCRRKLMKIIAVLREIFPPGGHTFAKNRKYGKNVEMFGRAPAGGGTGRVR